MVQVIGTYAFSVVRLTNEKGSSLSRALACSSCGKEYKYKSSLYTHRRYECGKDPKYFCTLCPYKTVIKGNYKRHFLTRHSSE
ncbi:hypothetical protein ILUMI_02648 [Ignelater luminosus]|uniref:C2H2-type domain-containing protein n=1 Tax=Ignelater luminosus TaxID=2038154 RepID=A0A8K0GJ33_IGNLU|nr:hypothetical protein ILUMI_02648 [Ignelater luminosus]